MTPTETRAADILLAALRKSWPASFKDASEAAVTALSEAGLFLVTREELERLEDGRWGLDIDAAAAWARAKLDGSE